MAAQAHAKAEGQKSQEPLSSPTELKGCIDARQVTVREGDKIRRTNTFFSSD